MPEQKFIKKPCPDQADIVNLFLGETDPKNQKRLLDHILSCPACKAKFKVLSDMGREVRKDKAAWMKLAESSLRELKAAEKRSRFRARPARLRTALVRWAGAFILAAGALAAGYFFLLTPSQNKTLRCAGKGELRLLEPEGRVKNPPSVFKWTPVANAKFYNLDVLDQNLETIAHVDRLDKTSYQTPPELLEKLKGRETYVWSVEAFDDNVNKINSALQSFNIE